jgi:hypothetical protein
MSNAAVIAVLDEFDEVIHGLVGLYFDASTGFSFIKEMNERHLQNLISNHQYDPAKRPTFTYSDGDPQGSNAIVYHVAPIEQLITRNEKQGGHNQASLGRSILVILYSYWEDHYRQQLATALGCPKNEVTGDIWGDISYESFRRLTAASGCAILGHGLGMGTMAQQACVI